MKVLSPLKLFFHFPFAENDQLQVYRKVNFILLLRLPFSGWTLQKHIQNNKGRTTPHKLMKRVWFCIMCNERSEQEEKGDFNHSSCKYIQLSKSSMQLVLDGDELINRIDIIQESNKKAEKKMEKKAEGEKIVGGNCLYYEHADRGAKRGAGRGRSFSSWKESSATLNE